MPLLQLALDDLTLDSACALVTTLAEQIDIVEVGTPLIKRYGMESVRRLRQVWPRNLLSQKLFPQKLFLQKLLVADMKTMDAGALEANLAFDAGADVITLLGCASNRTIEAALDVANKRQKLIAVDLLSVVDKPTRARQLEQMGVHFIGIHTASDDQKAGDNPLVDLASVRAAVSCPLVVAGGIKPQTIAPLLPYNPAVLIVGSFLTATTEPLTAVAALRKILEGQAGIHTPFDIEKP